MRRFSADYLRDSRRGLWADDRAALSPLHLADRGRVLDVGAGTGGLTRHLAADSPGTVVAVDADPSLLADVTGGRRIAGDAHRLPVSDDSFDLVVCQALLINLAEPRSAVREFARVSTDAVAAIEPDNDAVTVDSTVPAESRLADRARTAYMDAVGTDVGLGADAASVFEAAGLGAVETHRHEHVRTVEPPYSPRALAAARRKARGTRLDDAAATLLCGDLTRDGYDDLRADWRAMGRAVVEQMRAGDYRREETVPLYVTVGEVPRPDDGNDVA